MKRSNTSQDAGFSMIEVLIAIVIVAIGLLGVAKMQAAAVSNTQVSRVQSLMALQARSLAAAMHANRGFWAAGAAPAAWTATGSTVNDPSGVLSNAGVNCGGGSTCDPPSLAAYDVQTWVANMNSQFPTYNANVTCTTALSAPISCSIQLSWLEKTVAINRGTAASAAQQTTTQQYTLLVEP